MTGLSELERFVKNNAKVGILVFAFLNEIQVRAFGILHTRHAQRAVEIERNDTCTID